MGRRTRVSPETLGNITAPTAEQIAAPDARDALNGDDNWKRPSDLEAPPERKGYRQRWIRTAVGNNPDARHWSKKQREGWRPRPADSVPGGFSPPTIQHGQFGNVIGVEDMILCEMPIEKVRQREAWVHARTRAQMEGIKHDLRKNAHPSMPYVEQEFRSSVSRGSKSASIRED